MIKVVITGAECSGKTTLAEDLAQACKATLIPEYSRQFLSNLDRPYEKADLISMALGQQKSEEKVKDEDLVICDTSLLVLKIWSMVKYNTVHPWITVLLQDDQPDLYILPDCNIPFESDPFRESQDNNHDSRPDLRQRYIDELNRLEIPWISVTGTPEQRLAQAMKRIDILIGEKS